MLDRIRGSKPTIKLEELRRFERGYKSRKQMLKNQFEPSRHGYIARESHNELRMPLMPSVSSIMDGRLSTGRSGSHLNSFRQNPASSRFKLMNRGSVDIA